MNHKLISSVLPITLFMSSVTKAAVIYADSFDYTVGTALIDSASWDPANAGTAPSIASGSLSISGLASSGNKVSIGSGNIQEAIASLGSSTNSGTVFFSFQVSLTAQPTTTTYSFALSTAGTSYSTVVWLQASGSGYNVGLSNRSSGVTPTYDPSVISLNTTIFLVGSYTFNGAAGDDTSALWINPSSATFGGSAPTATLTSSGGTDMSTINQFLIRGTSGSPSSEFDELKIGTSYADVTTVVVPEASSLMFSLVGMAGLFSRRRR